MRYGQFLRFFCIHCLFCLCAIAAFAIPAGAAISLGPGPTGGGGGGGSSQPPQPNPTVPPGPKFLWGAATSAYQVEGGFNCWDKSPKTPCNDYDFFNGNPLIQARVATLAGFHLSTAGIADREWKPAVYKRDFDNARTLGLNAMRISIAWSRVEPKAPTKKNGHWVHSWNKAALDHYRQMIEAMRARGIEPIVTLDHFTLPIWVLSPPQNGAVDPQYMASFRGWVNPQTVKLYVSYVRKVVSVLKDKVDWWITINEPVASMIDLGYIAGVWSPGFLGNGNGAKSALHNLIVAHVKAYDAIKSLDDVDANGDGIDAQVGIAHSMNVTVAADPSSRLDDRTAARNFDYFANDYFINAVTRGQEDLHYLNARVPTPGQHPRIHPDWKHHLDFLGINYYRRLHVFHDLKLDVSGTGFVGGSIDNDLYGKSIPHELLNDLGWAIYPQGLYDLIMRAKNRWNIPVLVTENGLPENQDRNRAAYIIAHVRAVQRAIHDGAKVIGYLYWSLMDNWELQEGYRTESQFGLFHIDRSKKAAGKPILHRQITEGALAYADIIRESRASNPRGIPTAAAVAATQAKFGTFTQDGQHVTPPVTSNGGFWLGSPDPNGKRRILYLSQDPLTQSVHGFLFDPESRVWSAVDAFVDGQSIVLREHQIQPTGEDNVISILVSAKQGTLVLRGSVQDTMTPVRSAGLWQWKVGDSPWGSRDFVIDDLENGLVGKYLTFQQGTPGPKWKVFSKVTKAHDELLLLEHHPKPKKSSIKPEDEFDLSLHLARRGDTMQAVTDGHRHGSFTASKAPVVARTAFRKTGAWADHGDWWWTGARKEAPGSAFAFLEKRKVFEEFPASTLAPPAAKIAPFSEYMARHDLTSIVPLAAFHYHPHPGFLGLVGGHADLDWSAAGRHYEIKGAALPPVCLNTSCKGTWSDIDGLTAERIPPRFPPIVGVLADRRIVVVKPVYDAHLHPGANVTLQAPSSFDLQDAALHYTWSVGTRTGKKVSMFLPMGQNNVCVQVGNANETVKRCAKMTLVPLKLTVPNPNPIRPGFHPPPLKP